MTNTEVSEECLEEESRKGGTEEVTHVKGFKIV